MEDEFDNWSNLEAMPTISLNKILAIGNSLKQGQTTNYFFKVLPGNRRISLRFLRTAAESKENCLLIKETILFQFEDKLATCFEYPLSCRQINSSRVTKEMITFFPGDSPSDYEDGWYCAQTKDVIFEKYIKWSNVLINPDMNDKIFINSIKESLDSLQHLAFEDKIIFD